MFMIERVTGHRFPKDGIHTIYKIEKTRPAAANQPARAPTLMRISLRALALALGRARR
jgi:hypothetical protein